MTQGTKKKLISVDQVSSNDNYSFDEYDFQIDHQGDNYVRILKSFHVKSIPPYLKPIYSYDRNQKFLLRFYIPHDFLRSRKNSNSQTCHVVIMINGLDEFIPQQFKFYDNIGSKLTEQGIASVLLSTPFHLHRAVSGTHSENGKEMQTPFIKPSEILLLDHCEVSLFNHYLAVHEELNQLIRLIKGEDREENDFYKNHFLKNPKITLLGYSMGGLITHGYFYQYNTDISNHVLLNTSPELQGASTEGIGIGQGAWEQLFRKDEKVFERYENQIINAHSGGLDVRNRFNVLYRRRPYSKKATEVLKDIQKDISDLDKLVSKNNQRQDSKKIELQKASALLKKMVDKTNAFDAGVAETRKWFDDALKDFRLAIKHESIRRRILIIMGGSDEIVDSIPWKNFLATKSSSEKKETFAVNQEILAGMKHNMVKDSVGASLIPIIVNRIILHMEYNESPRWQEDEAVTRVYEIISGTNYFLEQIYPLRKSLNETKHSVYSRTVSKQICNEIKRVKPELKGITQYDDATYEKIWHERYSVAMTYFKDFRQLLSALCSHHTGVLRTPDNTK